MNVKLDEGAFLPKKAHPTDAGYDLRSPVDITVPPTDVFWKTMEDGRKAIGVEIGKAFIDTGVHIQLPQGFHADVRGRSGLAVRDDISVFVGLIDGGYRGGIGIKLYNLSAEPYKIHRGDRIAQLVFVGSETFDLIQVEELDDSDRGSAGFGSTGK